MSALTVLRDQVITPILVGVARPHRGRRPSTWTKVDHDYDTLSLRVGMHTLFSDLGLATAA